MGDQDLELSELEEEAPPSEGEQPLEDDQVIDVPEVPQSGQDLEAVFDIPVQVSAVLGKSTMEVAQLLRLGRGAVVELDRIDYVRLLPESQTPTFRSPPPAYRMMP